MTTTDTPRTYAEAEICKITQKTTKTPQNMTNKSTEVERLKEDVIAAQESEAVWKTEADKADQRRLEAEAEVERLRNGIKGIEFALKTAQTDYHALLKEVDKIKSEVLKEKEPTISSKTPHFHHESYCRKCGLTALE